MKGTIRAVFDYYKMQRYLSVSLFIYFLGYKDRRSLSIEKRIGALHGRRCKKSEKVEPSARFKG